MATQVSTVAQISADKASAGDAEGASSAGDNTSRKQRLSLTDGSDTTAGGESMGEMSEADPTHHEADGQEVTTLTDDEDLNPSATEDFEGELGGVQSGQAPGSKDFNLWGKLGHLTPKQHDALMHFLDQVSVDLLTKHKNQHDTVQQFALRWLRGREFKVKDAIKMFTNHVKWLGERQFYKLQFAALPDIVGTTEIDNDFIIKNYPCGIKGHDRLGRPLYFKHYGRMNPKAISKKVDAYHAAQWESVIGSLRMPYLLALSSEKRGYHVEEMVVIIDCQGFKLKTFNKYVREVLKRAAEVSNPNYPEMLGLCMVINAPWFVKTIWAVAKGFLARRTRKKFRILGKKFHKVLHSIVDPAELPAEYGGTGERGFKTVEELFEYDKAFSVFRTPEYHASVEKEPRNRPFLGLARAQAAAHVKQHAAEASAAPAPEASAPVGGAK